MLALNEPWLCCGLTRSGGCQAGQSQTPTCSREAWYLYKLATMPA